MLVLLQHGASLDIRDKSGNSALDRVIHIIEWAGERDLAGGERRLQDWKDVRRDGAAIVRFLLENVKPGGISEEERRRALIYCEVLA